MVLMRTLLMLIECKSKLFRGNSLNINQHEDDGGFDQKKKKKKMTVALHRLGI